MILLPALLALGQAPKWMPFAGEGFSVDLPGKPQIARQTFSAQGVSGRTKNYIVPTAAFACVASVTTLAKPVSPAVMRNIVGGIRTGFLNSVRGVATADGPATYAGRTGRLIDFNTGGGQPGKLWVVSVGGRIFVLTVLGRRGFPAAEARRFFGSLRVR